MRNLWVGITVRRSRRATWTIVGLAICTMYLSGTIALVGGLHQTTTGIASTFKQGPIVAFRGTALSESRVPQSSLADLHSMPAKVFVVVINVSVLGSATPVQTHAAYVDDPDNLLGLGVVNMSSGDAMLGSELNSRFADLGMPLYMGARLNLSAHAHSIPCEVVAVFATGALIPVDWILVNGDTIRTLDPSLKDNCSYVVLPEGDVADKSTLEANGYSTQNSMAVINFFELGIYQIESALWGLILITGVIVCLLIYSTISIEVAMRRGDIRLLKKIGSEPRRVGMLFVARGFYLALVGGLLGVCAGYFAAHFLISMASLRGLTTLIVPQASFNSLVMPLAVVLIASLIGSAIPSFMASREPMGGGA